MANVKQAETRPPVERVKCICGETKLKRLCEGKLTVLRCRRCKTFVGGHGEKLSGLPWTESHASTEFLAALQLRRELQVDKIIALFQLCSLEQPVLDYGCGQGVFYRAAKRHGIQVVGADLNPQLSDNDIVALSKPWEIPRGNWRTLVMLDVLEHHTTPEEFLMNVSAAHIILKLPCSKGPSILLARALGRFGENALWRRLFLADDPFPHYWIPSRKGLGYLAERTGYKVILQRYVPEFGRELPERLRLGTSVAQRAAVPVVRVFGLLFEQIGNLWSDTRVVVLRKCV
jgi:SAM-dependent methyltransferase